MERSTHKRRIQLTGFRNQEKKVLVDLLLKLDCFFFDTKQYRNCTHLIAKEPCKSEKFLAACAAGKWILTKDYIINSAESGRWLDETSYEWGYKIEKDSHYSPQTQSAPKRWREELTRSGSAGAFHRWKVVLLVAKGDKQRDSLRRVLEAGKATVYDGLYVPDDVTHVLTNKMIFSQETEKHAFGASYYPIQYLGIYLLENEIRSDTEKYHENALNLEKRSSEELVDIHLREIRNELIKHIYSEQIMIRTYTQMDQMNECTKKMRNTHCSEGTNNILELVDDNLFSIAIAEFLSGKDLIPPVKLLHSLLEYILEGNTESALFVQFFRIMYTLLEHDPPWKSSKLRYYLDVLQCPVCMVGTWPLVEMLMRFCVYGKNVCHPVPVSENLNEKRMFHKHFLMFFMNLFQAEVIALTKSVSKGTDAQLQVMPQTILLKTFWLGNESVFFTKQINILVDCVINSYRDKSKTNDIFKHEIAEILIGILGVVVEYWILSGFVMDKNTMHPVADDLASYIAISCNDFSPEELKMFISSTPSLWLQMFIAEAVFKNLSARTNAVVSTEHLSLKKIVCSYLPTIQVWIREPEKIKNTKRKKIGQWPCPESQRALLMLNGNKQNQAEVLPDVPICVAGNSSSVPKKLENKAEDQASYSKKNCHLSAKPVNIYKVNVKGETALHIACKRNNVKRLIHLLSLPGIDINVKDYAGWTPLHEACNHGSTVCVREILQHFPEVDLFHQVDGVTPLHDALSNGHIEIAKLLIQHGGLLLLQQKDSDGNLPLDLLTCETTKQQLLHLVSEAAVEDFHAETESILYNQQIELWTVLFCKMLLNFCSVYNLFRPFPANFRKLVCSNPLLLTAGCSIYNIDSSRHWLIDLYLKELETFQNLPEHLQKTIEEIEKKPGEQKEAFTAALHQISLEIQMSNLYLANNLPN